MSWRVEVYRDGESLVSIEPRLLTGKPDLSESDLQVIREAAENLKSFAGTGEVRCENCDQPIPDEGERRTTDDDVTLCVDCWDNIDWTAAPQEPTR